MVEQSGIIKTLIELIVGKSSSQKQIERLKQENKQKAQTIYQNIRKRREVLVKEYKSDQKQKEQKNYNREECLDKMRQCLMNGQSQQNEIQQETQRSQKKQIEIQIQSDHKQQEQKEKVVRKIIIQKKNKNKNQIKNQISVQDSNQSKVEVNQMKVENKNNNDIINLGQSMFNISDQQQPMKEKVKEVEQKQSKTFQKKNSFINLNIKSNQMLSQEKEKVISEESYQSDEEVKELVIKNEQKQQDIVLNLEKQKQKQKIDSLQQEEQKLCKTMEMNENNEQDIESQLQQLQKESLKRIERIQLIDDYFKTHCVQLSEQIKNEINNKINFCLNRVNKNFGILLKSAIELRKFMQTLNREETKTEFIYLCKQLVIKILSQRIQKIGSLKTQEKFESMTITILYFGILSVNFESFQNYMICFFQRKYPILLPRQIEVNNISKLDFHKQLGFNSLDEQLETCEQYSQRLEIYSFSFIASLCLDLSCIESYIQKSDVKEENSNHRKIIQENRNIFQNYQPMHGYFFTFVDLFIKQEVNIQSATFLHSLLYGITLLPNKYSNQINNLFIRLSQNYIPRLIEYMTIIKTQPIITDALRDDFKIQFNRSNTILKQFNKDRNIRFVLFNDQPDIVIDDS